MLKVCITFDYELFFGRNNGTEQETLFLPTNQLLEMLKEEGVSATFFADVCSLIQSERIGKSDYVYDMSNQLKELYRNGQDIQLHIHPHWLRSEFKNNEWKFDRESYRIHSFGFDRNKPDNVYDILKNGINCLHGILREVDSNYQCIAFRAGGFAIQPHEELVKALYETGIRIDSSIAPQLAAGGTTNYYNYRHRLEHVNWRIAYKTEWWQDNNKDDEALYEVPIATENKNPITFFINRLFRPDTIKLRLGTKRGSYINESDSSSKGNNKVMAYWNYIRGYNALSVDAYNAKFLYNQLIRYYKHKNCTKRNAAIAIIGHPKLVTEEYISNLRTFISLIKNDRRFVICNMNDIYNDLVTETE